MSEEVVREVLLGLFMVVVDMDSYSLDMVVAD